jgi:hypothetical protein
MIIGWIVTRSRASGLTEFISEDNVWTIKLSECAIFRDKNVAQSHLNNNDDYPEELIPVEVQF